MKAEANKKVIGNFWLTTIAMFTLPIIAYFAMDWYLADGNIFKL